MTELMRTLERLRRWPNLWRHPDLFLKVYGFRADEQTPATLADALVQAEAGDANDPRAATRAWSRIVQNGDLAAVQVAWDAFLATGLRQTELDAGLATARKGFEKRVEIMDARASRLTYRHRSLEDELRAAREFMVRNPTSAESRLAEATRLVEAAERVELGELESRIVLENVDPVITNRLRDAIAAKNLRLARVYAGHLAAGALVTTEAPDPAAWLDRQPVDKLISWYLDPGTAPARFTAELTTAVEPGSAEELLLSMLAKLANSDVVEQETAREIVTLTLLFLGEENSRIEAVDVSGDEVWAFEVVSEKIAHLFPHVVSDVGVVLAILPRRKNARPVGLSPDLRFVSWDLYDGWHTDREAGLITVSRQMLLHLLRSTTDRGRDFVRLLSRGVSVRLLILAVLGKEPRRLFAFAGTEPGAMTGTADDDKNFAKFIGALFGALDLEVYDDDLRILHDASGTRPALLARILHVIAERLDDYSSSRRRFDVLEAVMERGGETAIDAQVGAYLDREFGERLEHERRVLEVIDYILEIRQEAEGGDSMPQNELVDAFYHEAASSLHFDTLIQAATHVDQMVAFGFLRMSLAPAGHSGDERWLSRNQTLPYRIMLRR